MIVPYFLISLFPLGIYLLVLAAINRRERPVMIAGIWDALLLSMSISGILLWIGPALLGAFYERGLLPGAADHNNRQFNQIWTLYPLVWLAYYGLIITGQALMMVSRRNKTIIYNTNAAILETLVANAVAEKGYRVWRTDGLIVLDKSDSDSPHPPKDAGAIQIESFPPLRHATIHWHVEDNLLRQSIDNEVYARLDQAATSDNPSVTWLLAISGILFGAVFLGAIYIILASMMPLRGF